ncbi:RNA polymerase sigma-70 factor [Dinghuibacter silviterrae]|uniref:RNA polymerase sigma-70 factor (ECF subfamily) n=1 Tax=Dinghuibacter silviterrae TaxID=1539049 RepID=A0A4R8DH99_9BACT|nr:RNA polymerase sigma-70 factor [Dinghuibacter silviterrae]TDW96905.1 RNA polymerase sigma-70 factor (ECF subfamily) [Dinghuibacter silviterrae]
MLSVKDLKDGDAIYFKEVFDQYHQKLYFFILSKTKSEYIAEEVVQMAFTKLWQCRHTLQEEYAISTQLFRIAHTILIDFLRKYNHTDAVTTRLDTLSIDRGIDSTTEKMREAELQKRISEAVNDLPPIRKQVFAMSREQGMTYREIAETLSVSSKTVEAHIYKALKQIKKYIV